METQETTLYFQHTHLLEVVEGLVMLAHHQTAMAGQAGVIPSTLQDQSLAVAVAVVQERLEITGVVATEPREVLEIPHQLFHLKETTAAKVGRQHLSLETAATELHPQLQVHPLLGLEAVAAGRIFWVGQGQAARVAREAAVTAAKTERRLKVEMQTRVEAAAAKAIPAEVASKVPTLAQAAQASLLSKSPTRLLRHSLVV